jgi:putative membrane protein
MSSVTTSTGDVVRKTAVLIGVVAGRLATTGPAQAAPAADFAQDAAFLQAAHQANLAEIIGGRIAERRGVSAQVRELGARFVHDHTAMDAGLVATAAALDVQLPDTPGPADRRVAERYWLVDQTEFDRMYLTSQLAGHRAVMKALRQELAAGPDQRVRQLAAGAEPIVAAHMTALKAARHDLGGGYSGGGRA